MSLDRAADRGTRPVDPLLVRAWLSARSTARGLPQPVAESGGWRVETASPAELRRYVFAEASDGLRQLGETIREPGILLKLCGSEAALRSLLPARWQILAPGYMMVCRSGPRGMDCPSPYRATVTVSGPVVSARISTRDGETAATGFAAEGDGVFIFDRIATEPAHRRRGLGSAIMALLASARKSPDATQILVATRDGRALYEALGWSVYSPYTTATLPPIPAQ